MSKKLSGNPPLSLFPFWNKAVKDGWKKSREKFGLAVDITLALSAIGLSCFTWYSGHHPQFDADKESAFMSYWFALIPVGLWILWFGWHVLKAPHDIYKELYGKYEIELERNRPKFKVSCDKDKDGRLLLTPKSGFGYFRIKVETDCVGGITGCLGHLNLIEKDGIVLFDHESLQLPFAKSEESDSLAKRLAQNNPKWLDILFIILHQQNAIQESGKGRPTYQEMYQAGSIPGNPDAIPEDDDNDIVCFPTLKNFSNANDRNGRYIFESPGEYILHVNITGDIGPTEMVQLKFSWTGHAKTSGMEIINNKSVTKTLDTAK